MSATEALEMASREPEGPWQRLPTGARIVIVLIGVVVGLNLLARFVSDSTGGSHAPSGKRSSAYGAQSDGVAAYAELLVHDGHPVRRTRGALQSTTLDPSTTVVILDPDTISSADDALLRQFVTDGGRLVIGGSQPRYFVELRDSPPVWAPNGQTRWQRIDASLAPIHTIVSAGDGHFDDIGEGGALVGSARDALVSATSIGTGTIDFVADSSILQNRLLATADNAALGLALAGEPGRTVVFPEGVHGYGPARGLAAVPGRWKIALLGLAFAGLVLMWARGRRLGPPEDTSRPLPPPRAAYVDAVGSTLARTRRPGEALQPVAERVRAQIEARAVHGVDGPAGATANLDRAEFARRAHAAGLSDAEIEAVLSPITDDSVLALGSALSRVVSSTGREQQ